MGGKHDGKRIEAMPMLFTYKPVKQQQAGEGPENSAGGGFQQAGVASS